MPAVPAEVDETREPPVGTASMGLAEGLGRRAGVLPVDPELMDVRTRCMSAYGLFALLLSVLSRPLVLVVSLLARLAARTGAPDILCLSLKGLPPDPADNELLRRAASFQPSEAWLARLPVRTGDWPPLDGDPAKGSP